MFSEGSYATVWEIRPAGNNIVQARISTSKKDSTQPNGYVTDFSGFISVFNSSIDKAKDKMLSYCDGKEKKFGGNEAPRIKIGRCGVSTKFDVKANKAYTNYLVFSFEDASKNSGSPKKQTESKPVDNKFIDIPFDTEAEELPFA